MNEEISLSQAFDLGTPSQDNIIPDGKEPVNTIAMQDIFKQREMNLDFVENMNQKKESGFLTDVSAGLERFYFGITDIPDNLKNAVIRGFNGHIFPNMTEQQATMLMESVTREQMARNQYRRNVEALEGVAPDSITANITSGIAQAVFYGLTGNFLGGIGMGIEAGLQAGGETNLQYAESYLAKHGSMQGYKGTDDFIYSSLNGAINGYIEQALGVENLFRGTVDKFVKGGTRQFVRSAIEEGTEEVLQEYAGYGIGKLADYENVESYREQRSFAEATKDALVNGIYGAIIGGAVGGSLYMVNRGRIAKALREQYGLNEKESLEAATDYIENGSSKILDEVQINDELTNAFGESYEQLKTKIKDSIQATGTQIYGENIDEYVNLVAKDIGLQVITNARAFNIPTREYLDLANIQSFDNILSLERVDLNDVDVVKDLIKSKKAELKDLNLKQKTGIDTKAQRGVLTRQIAQLQVIQKKIDKPVSVEQKQNNPVLTDILGNKFNNITLTPQIKSMENLEIGEIINNMPELKTALKTVLPRTQGLNKENFAQIINSPANNNNLKENVMSYVVTYGTPEQIKEFLVNYSNKQVENLENKTGFSDRDLLLQALEESGIGTEQERRAVLLSETPSIDNTVEKQLFQIAYAGSRVDYDRPSLEAIGSGEGQQVHGYGLYYALNKDVAEGYRETFTNENKQVPYTVLGDKTLVEYIKENGKQKAKEVIQNKINESEMKIKAYEKVGDNFTAQIWQGHLNELQTLLKAVDTEGKGQVHEVDIPEMPYLLDEQKPFNEQSDFVKKAVKKALKEAEITDFELKTKEDLISIVKSKLGKEASDIMSEIYDLEYKYKENAINSELDDAWDKWNKFEEKNDTKDFDPNIVYSYIRNSKMTGKEIYRNLILYLGSDIDASKILEKNGIKGITYEGLEDGRCFVIFNPDDVQVLRKKFDELGNVLFQERSGTSNNLLPQNANGYMDTELKTIVLGSNINQEYTTPTIDIDGVQKSALNSEGKPLGRTEQDIRNFYKWFGDSKVVDSQGRPLVVYHGTLAGGFATFKNAEKGIWFSDNEDVAGGYGYAIDDETGEYIRLKGDDSKRDNTKQGFWEQGIYETYLKLNNPLIIDFKGEVATNTSETEIYTEQARKQGNDGVIIKNIIDTVYGEQQKVANDYVVLNSNQIKSVENVGTYSSETGNIYQQEGLLPQNANGYMDTELKTIVLGSNINQGTLPHEFAHFFLQKNFDLWKQGNPNAQFDMLAEQLGITKDQDMLTREQQEQFAYMTEAYIFGKGLGSNVSPVVKAYLNWIPAEYESVINMGYKRADGTEYNPVINDSMKNYFDTAYATLGLSTSPTVRANTNIPDDKGEPLPSNKEVRLDRSKQIKVEPETIKMTPQDSVNETKAMVKYGMPEDNWVSTIIPGQGTNTREQQQQEASEWVSKNKEEAKRIAFGNHMQTESDFEQNTAPVDRAFVIREVMKDYSPDSVEYAMLKHKLATYLSLSGKALGLNNDLSFRTYLDSYAKLNNALREKAAFLRYGKSNKAVQLFDADVDKFIATWMDAVVNTKEGSQERDMAVKNFIESAKQEFETDTILMQENIFEQLKTANRKNFELLAKNYVKKLAGALPTNQNIADLMKLANRAQALSKNIDSNNAEEAITAGKAIRELQNYIRDKGIPQGFMQKLIGGWMPRAMLSSPSTHLTNAISNTVQAGIIKITNIAYYGKNIVSTQVMNNEKARLKKIYENTGFNLAQQYTINDKALIKGERYETTPNAEAKGWRKYDPMKFLGNSDFRFRNNLYIDTLSHIASKNANGDVKKANELFNKYKQLATTDEESLKARQEALLVANIGVFTQNGKFAAILSQIRNSLDMINVDISKQGVAFGVKGNQGLGTMLAPFIKTPANIIELGARAIASPFTTIYTLAKGEKLSITQAIDLGEATAALLAFAALAVASAKYQGTDDPYDRKSDTIQFGNWSIKLDNFGVMAQPLRQALTLSSMYMGKDWLNTGISQLPILSEVEKVKLMRDDFGKFINDFTAEQAGKIVPSLIKPLTKYSRQYIDKELGTKGLDDNKYIRKWTSSIGLRQSRSAVDDWIEAVLKTGLGNKIQVR